MDIKPVPSECSSEAGPTTDAFTQGMNVRYVPNHAHGDVNHPNCENGIVSSTNAHYVFVRYYSKYGGLLQYTAQATDPADLIKT